MAQQPRDPFSFEELERAVIAEDTRKEKAANDAELRRDAWRWLAKNPRGLIIIADILKASGWLRQSYIQGDAAGTAFREGQRSVGQQVFDTVGIMIPNSLPKILERLTKP